MKRTISKIVNGVRARMKGKKTVEDAFQLQKKLLLETKGALTIFDAGAHFGNTALKYDKLFPSAAIYCFEPFRESFEKMKGNIAQHENIKPFNKALGKHVGVSQFHSNMNEQTNSILATHAEADNNWGGKAMLNTKEVLEVEVTTIDQIVEEEGLEKIDILKMDVQGAEYQVMEGARETIKKNKIKLIYTEIIAIPTYEGQQELDEALKMYRDYGFELINIYNSGHTASGRLQFIDAIFINANSSGVG